MTMKTVMIILDKKTGDILMSKNTENNSWNFPNSVLHSKDIEEASKVVEYKKALELAATNKASKIVKKYLDSAIKPEDFRFILRSDIILKGNPITLVYLLLELNSKETLKSNSENLTFKNNADAKVEVSQNLSKVHSKILFQCINSK